MIAWRKVWENPPISSEKKQITKPRRKKTKTPNQSSIKDILGKARSVNASRIK